LRDTELGRAYGEWKGESGTETRRRRAEEEREWLVSNKWLTIITTPSPVFLKVLISGGFKFFRKNTFRSVDSEWFIGALSLDKSNFRGSEGKEERLPSPLRLRVNGRGWDSTNTGEGSTP
jgi:hypothetical protein